MSVYTRQDLKVMQGWPLERKVEETKALIDERFWIISAFRINAVIPQRGG